MWPLVNDMVQDDPSKRPTMDEVVERFEKIRQSLAWWTLRSRLIHQSDSFWRFAQIPLHFTRSFIYVLTRRKAIPVPPESPQHRFKF